MESAAFGWVEEVWGCPGNELELRLPVLILHGREGADQPIGVMVQGILEDLVDLPPLGDPAGVHDVQVVTELGQNRYVVADDYEG